jgi:hypothetical protein
MRGCFTPKGAEGEKENVQSTMYNVQIRDEMNLVRGRIARVFAFHYAKKTPQTVEIKKTQTRCLRFFIYKN